MSSTTETPKWDPDFSAVKARWVTLKDDKGTLYAVQAHFLAAESKVFKDMFSCAIDTDDPIEADFSSTWMKHFLFYVTTNRWPRSLSPLSAYDLGLLYAWTLKFECVALPYFVRCSLTALHTNGGQKQHMLDLFQAAVETNSVKVAKEACSFHEHAVKYAEEVSEILPQAWRLPFVLCVLHCIQHQTSRTALGDEFEKRINVNEPQAEKRGRSPRDTEDGGQKKKIR